jgi:hypothetical protein
MGATGHIQLLHNNDVVFARHCPIAIVKRGKRKRTGRIKRASRYDAIARTEFNSTDWRWRTVAESHGSAGRVNLRPV